MSNLTISEKKALRSYSENIMWFREHSKELQKKHAGRFVAINDGDVIDYDTDPRRLIERLRGAYGVDNITTFAIEFVSKDDLDLII